VPAVNRKARLLCRILANGSIMVHRISRVRVKVRVIIDRYVFP